VTYINHGLQTCLPGNLRYSFDQPVVGSPESSRYTSPALGSITYSTDPIANGHDDSTEIPVLVDMEGRVSQTPHSSPMSYALEGKQYFAIAAGSDLFAFALA